MHRTPLIRRQRIHGPQDNIKEEDEVEIEEEVVVAEIDSGDDLADSELDSESTDDESELTDITMPSTASSTRSGRIVRPRAQEEYFLLNQCMFLPKHCIV